MARVLRNKLVRRTGLVLRQHLIALRKRGRIQIVSEIEAHRTHWSLVTYTDADGLRNIVVVALLCGTWLQTELRAFLAPAQEVVKHVMRVGKHVPGVVENGKAHVVLEKRQGRRGSAEFDVVHEQAGSTQREPGCGITRSGLV